MKNLLISACLLGFECKYSGGSNALDGEKLEALKESFRLIPVCPESAGGLPTPRPPSERRDGKVINKLGQDVTEEYRKGAETALYLARRYGCACALLKERSPSCGSGEIYDGSFTGTLVPGDGTAAQALKARGLRIYGEGELEQLLSLSKAEEQ